MSSNENTLLLGAKALMKNNTSRVILVHIFTKPIKENKKVYDEEGTLQKNYNLETLEIWALGKTSDGLIIEDKATNLVILD